jgi:hypothetical protein
VGGRQALRDWVYEIFKDNESFKHLVEKAQFILVGRIAKELQTIQENKGPEFFEAYKVELEPILKRVNWIYSKHPQFVWKRWNGIKRQIIKTLRGNDQLVKVPVEVVAHQVNAIHMMAEKFVEGHQINSPKPEKEWIKNPRGGWIKNPRVMEEKI